jgi:hypothetical protein
VEKDCRTLKWVTALNLGNWANTVDARTTLSEMISALVRASASDIQSFRFPTGDSAQIQGYDGRLTAKGAPPYVPDGESVWEFGTTADFLDKANSDYKDRTATPGTAEPKETTFVAVTARIWNAPKMTLELWEKEKRAEGIWKDVRVIDAVALETWFDAHPAVAARVARYILGQTPLTGARSTDEFWEEYSSRFKPALMEQVLTCDREEQVKELLAELGKGAQDIVRRADSPDEVVAFAVAGIRQAESDLRKFLEARTLIIDTDDAARQLAHRPNMVFIPRASALPQAGMLARRNPTIVPLGRDATRLDVTVLNRPSTGALSAAIEKMGLDHDAAYQLARMSGRSVTILGRRIPNGDAGKPQWADGRRTLIPALLAGGWDAASEHDKDVLRVIANVAKYEEYENSLRPLLKLQDSPLDQEGQVWKMRAPVDAFVHLGYLIGAGDLENLSIAATDVFSEIDPSLDLPDEDRPFLLTERTKLRHSEWLRDGLATGLLQIAALHREAELAVAEIPPPAFVDALVQGLPGLARDYRLIASLKNQLPLLMEAAPGPLLSALERLLEGDGSAIVPIFRKGGTFGPTSPHTYVLWALEGLAWDPDQLNRVGLVLAKLARIDPGGATSNRPIATLREIFLHWHPGTNATLAQRLAALDYIVAREPQVGWKLLIALLPENSGIAHMTSKPRYREAGASERETLTWALVYEGARQIIKRALDLVGDDPTRWTAIIAALANFEPPMRNRTYQLLEGFIARAGREQRELVWNALRDEVNRHKAFPEAQWSLKGDDLAKLDALLQRLAPSDTLDRMAWLFDESYPDVPRKFEEGRRDAVEEARAFAVKEVRSFGGDDALLALAARTKYPQFVALAAVSEIENAAHADRLIDAALGQNDRLDLFSLALSGEAERKFAADWTARIVKRATDQRWTADQMATLLMGWRDTPATWDVAATLGPAVENSYWRRKTAWYLDGSEAEPERAARKYLAVGRGAAALDAVGRHVGTLPIQLVFDLLDATIVEINADKSQPNNMFLHQIGEIFDRLGKREDAPPLEVARREYAYLPLLRHRERHLTLHRLMAEEPSLYVSILCDVFKAASGQAQEPTEQQRARAHAGYQLLSSFHRVPGRREGEIEPGPLQTWTREVRRLAAEVDRSRIADQYIGHVLAHAPDDPTDKAWPHRAVRDLIEQLESSDVEKGITVERFNMRGVTTKAAYEGGKQERDIAEKYRRWAKVSVAHVRTSAMLGAIAKSWDKYADAEDERAEQDKMRFE